MIPDDNSPCINLLTRSFSENIFNLRRYVFSYQGFEIHKKNSSDFIVRFQWNRNIDNPKISVDDNTIVIETNDSFGNANYVAKEFDLFKIFLCSYLTAFGLFMLLYPIIGDKIPNGVSRTIFAISALIFAIFFSVIFYTNNLKCVIYLIANGLLAVTRKASEGPYPGQYATLGVVAGFLISRYFLLLFQIAFDQVS